jgi:hypothetical protein
VRQLLAERGAGAVFGLAGAVAGMPQSYPAPPFFRSMIAKFAPSCREVVLALALLTTNGNCSRGS